MLNVTQLKTRRIMAERKRATPSPATSTVVMPAGKRKRITGEEGLWKEGRIWNKGVPRTCCRTATLYLYGAESRRIADDRAWERLSTWRRSMHNALVERARASFYGILV
jgi:hypothetical protein